MVSELARRAIFMHELSHGEYYTNSYYATYCRRYWNETLSAAQRDAFINFFKKYNYEVSLTELVINEMQAYLMKTSIKRDIRIRAEGLAQVIEQGCHFDEQRLSAKRHAIISNGGRKMGLA